MPSKVLQTSFYNYGPKPFPNKLWIRQCFGEHTIARLYYDIRTPVAYVLPQEGTPVSIQWGISPTGVKTFYGYNNHYDTVIERRGDATTCLTILGTSKPMNSTVPTNWFGMTRSGIAKAVAERHKMRSIIHRHPVVVEDWTTGLRSDFQVLQKLAEETGFRFWVDGSTLYFLDPQKLLATAQRQSIPYYEGYEIRQTKVTGGAGAPMDDKPITRKKMYGLDYRNNELFLATSGDTSTPDQIIPMTASTYTEADTWLEAYQKNSSAYYTLEATVNGNALIEPGTLIQLADSPNVNDVGGYWAVLEVVHELDRSDFVSSIRAIRHVDKTPDIQLTTTVLGSPSSTQMVIRDGSTWEAAVQEHVNV